MSIILIALATLAFFALASTIAVYSYDASPIGHGVSRLSPCGRSPRPAVGRSINPFCLPIAETAVCATGARARCEVETVANMRFVA